MMRNSSYAIILHCLSWRRRATVAERDGDTKRERERDGARSGLGLLGVFLLCCCCALFVCLVFALIFFNVTFRIFPINLINCVVVVAVVVATFTQLFVLDCMFMHVETQPSQAGQTNGLRDSQTCVSTYGMPIRTQKHMA